MLDLIKDFFSNYLLMAAGCSWFLAQMIKVFTGIFGVKKFSLVELFFGTGGMPSSHSATVAALATASALSCGLKSSEFAITIVLALVVIRDASGIRNEVGKHARAINKMLIDLATSEDLQSQETALKELVGHTPLQVFVGVILGVAVAVVMRFIPIYAMF